MASFPMLLGSGYPASFGSLFRDMERWMRDWDEAYSGTTQSVPQFISDQDKDAYHVRVDLPGFTESDVKVDIHNGVVTVSGQRDYTPPEGYKPTHRERAALKFSKSLRLPDEVDDAQVKASMKDGVLSVTLPKRPEVKPRQIPVGVA